MANIRAMVPTDLLLARSAAQSLYRGPQPEEMLNRFTKYLFTRLFELKTSFGWVAEIDGVPVGILIVSAELHPYELPELYAIGELMYVKKAYRAQGISSQLARIGVEWAEVNHISRIKMSALRSNDHYNDMLTALGAKEIGVLYEWQNKS